VCDLMPSFDLSQPTISHHLKVLHESGLLDREKRGTWVSTRPDLTRCADAWSRKPSVNARRRPSNVMSCGGPLQRPGDDERGQWYDAGSSADRSGADVWPIPAPAAESEFSRPSGPPWDGAGVEVSLDTAGSDVDAVVAVYAVTDGESVESLAATITRISSWRWSGLRGGVRCLVQVGGADGRSVRQLVLTRSGDLRAWLLGP
jgi:hypothetical protein